jgi:hypothetical protein
MLFLYKFWQDEPQRLNRCAYVHRPQGCRQGAACRFCHIHPVSDADYKKRTGRGWGKKESAEQKKERLAAHEAKKAIGQERRLAKADLQGYLRYGKVLQCGDNSCSISIMTTLRSTDRAEATAAQVAKALGIDARAIFIRLNLDFKNPNHFESTDFVMGYQAYYLAGAYRVLPDLMLQQDQKADIHFLLEDDCVLNVLEKEGVLEALVSKFKDAPLAFLGYYGVGTSKREKWTYVAPPLYATQMFSVSHKFVHPLYELMSSKKPDDVDLFFMGQVPDMAFASHSIAGQSGHQSDCADNQDMRQSYLCPQVSIHDITCLNWTSEPHWEKLRLDLYNAHLQRHSKTRKRADMGTASEFAAKRARPSG